ncbi:MAG TPA: tetratricopeptide repeat protein [Croceibacterium sp.]|nr:tetratricopeptide repeat protein [Croceibacterium sp.]
MTGWRGRIGASKVGGGGVAAIAAVALAAAAIGWRVLGGGAAGDAPAPASAAGAADPLAELERRAAAEPGNAGAWQELGFALFARERFADAAAAYEKAIAADSDSAVLWSSLGEARVMASERDPMPAAAREAFRRAAALDPKDPRARYFLAVEKDLAGDHAGAIAAWLALLGDTPAGAPWEADLQRTIEQVGKINGIAVAERIAAALERRPAAEAAAPVMAGIPGPTQEQLAAASAMRPAEQQAMAEEMVARLAARLEREPGDVEGWVMLMRSYRALGRNDDARRVLQSALAANPDSGDELRSAAETLGVS